MSTKVEAMPQLLPVLSGSDKFVQKWKTACESTLRNGMNSARVTPLKIPGMSDQASGKVYHWEKKRNFEEGVYFATEDGKSIDFLYYYQGLQLQSPARKIVCEALAFRFNQDAKYTRGLLPILFFNFLLPAAKFVVTDSIYTKDGEERWFHPQYREALAHPGKYKVYAVDTLTRSTAEINLDQFWALQPRYWGSTEEFQRYRFAIAIADFHFGD